MAARASKAAAKLLYVTAGSKFAVNVLGSAAPNIAESLPAASLV